MRRRVHSRDFSYLPADSVIMLGVSRVEWDQRILNLVNTISRVDQRAAFLIPVDNVFVL